NDRLLLRAGIPGREHQWRGQIVSPAAQKNVTPFFPHRRLRALQRGEWFLQRARIRVVAARRNEIRLRAGTARGKQHRRRAKGKEARLHHREPFAKSGRNSAACGSGISSGSVMPDLNPRFFPATISYSRHRSFTVAWGRVAYALSQYAFVAAKDERRIELNGPQFNPLGIG